RQASSLHSSAPSPCRTSSSNMPSSSLIFHILSGTRGECSDRGRLRGWQSPSKSHGSSGATIPPAPSHPSSLPEASRSTVLLALPFRMDQATTSPPWLWLSYG